MSATLSPCSSSRSRPIPWQPQPPHRRHLNLLHLSVFFPQQQKQRVHLLCRCWCCVGDDFGMELIGRRNCSSSNVLVEFHSSTSHSLPVSGCLSRSHWRLRFFHCSNCTRGIFLRPFDYYYSLDNSSRAIVGGEDLGPDYYYRKAMTLGR